MPFKSEKQRKWMHANDPEMAMKWEKKEKLKKETRVKQLIKKMVREIMSEGKFKTLTMPNDMKTKVKVSKIIKKLRLKIDKDYDVKALKTRGGNQVISILPKHYNKFLDALVKNNINPRG